MSPAKKQDSSSSVFGWLGALFSWLLGPGRPLLAVVMLAALFGGGWYLMWRRIAPRIFSSPEYSVAAEQVEITRLPPWIHRDLRDFRAELFRDPTLAGPLSIMDADLTERISKAFSQHPWVAKVGPVTKLHPALVRVELVYRQPVCMVEAPGRLQPVDALGVLLPSEGLSPIEVLHYPRVVGVDRGPTVPPGKRWGDPIVIGGAEIAAALGPLSENMQLQQIVSLAAAGDARDGPREPTFALITRGGTRIRWGYAPGATNVLGEISAAEKVARLQHYWAGHDTPHSPQGETHELDVRTMPLSLRP